MVEARDAASIPSKRVRAGLADQFCDEQPGFWQNAGCSSQLHTHVTQKQQFTEGTETSQRTQRKTAEKREKTVLAIDGLGLSLTTRAIAISVALLCVLCETSVSSVNRFFTGRA